MVVFMGLILPFMRYYSLVTNILNDVYKKV